MYKKMLLIRRFEEKGADLAANKPLPGWLHAYIGEEAVAVGTCLALRKDDYIQSTHRGHGHCIAKGLQTKYMMAELFGKRTGYCKGKGGSMHIADLSVGMLGASGIVGGGLSLATGAALSITMKGNDQVVACFFGDGACNQGVFHESLNLASIWKLPVIFVCENNQYGQTIPVSKSMAVKDISTRSIAYNMLGVTVDGMDVIAVYEAVSEAAKRARKGGGPTLIECKTYRFSGHNVGDRGGYRTDEELEEWKKKDSINILRKNLLEKGILAVEDFEKIERETAKMIDEAVKFAEESPFPDPDEAFEDVFVSPYY